MKVVNSINLISNFLDFRLVDRELSFDCDLSGLLGGWNINWFGLAACVVRSGGCVHWGVGDLGGAVIARGGLVMGHNIRVDSLTLIGDLGHVATVRVRGVLDHLEPAVRERH